MLKGLSATSQNHHYKKCITLVIVGQVAAAAAVVPWKLPGFPGPPCMCWGQGLVQQAPERLHSGVWLQLWRSCALPTCSIRRFHESWSGPQNVHTHTRQGKCEWCQPVAYGSLNCTLGCFIYLLICFFFTLYHMMVPLYSTNIVILLLL